MLREDRFQGEELFWYKQWLLCISDEIGVIGDRSLCDKQLAQEGATTMAKQQEEGSKQIGRAHV